MDLQWDNENRERGQPNRPTSGPHQSSPCNADEPSDTACSSNGGAFAGLFKYDAHKSLAEMTIPCVCEFMAVNVFASFTNARGVPQENTCDGGIAKKPFSKLKLSPN